MGLMNTAVSVDQIKAEKEGIWRLVTCSIEERDGKLFAAEFKVRLWDSSGAQEEFMKLLQRNPTLASGKSNDAQRYKSLCQRKALVRKGLADWRWVEVERTTDEAEPYRRVRVEREGELEFENGVWVKHDERSAERLLAAPMRNHYEALQTAVHDEEAYKEYLEDVAKNSRSSSGGSSPTSESSNPSTESD